MTARSNDENDFGQSPWPGLGLTSRMTRSDFRGDSFSAAQTSLMPLRSCASADLTSFCAGLSAWAPAARRARAPHLRRNCELIGVNVLISALEGAPIRSDS